MESYDVKNQAYPGYIHDNIQYRERNNASWDRIRHENNASVRSEPIQYYFENNVQLNNDEINTTNSFNNSTGPNMADYPVNSKSTQQPLKESEHGDDLQDIREIPIYCISCDMQIDSNQKHDEQSCQKDRFMRYRCSTCSKQFRFETNLKVHVYCEHFSKDDFSDKMTCKICPSNKNSTFNRYSAFIGHIMTHQQSDVAVCKYCKEDQSDEVMLRRHIRLMHKEPNELAFCSKCQKTLALEDVKKHLALHAVHKKLNSKQKTEVKKTQPIKKFTCTACPKAFARAAELKRHATIHDRQLLDIPKWKCAICGKEYSHQTALNEHKRIVHSVTAKTHKCSFCAMVFTKKSNHDRHLRNIHPLESQSDSNSTKFECTDCGNIYSSFMSLQRHRRGIHNDGIIINEPNFERHICPVCNVEFKTAEMMKKHKSYHDVLEKERRSSKAPNYSCKTCDKSFVFKASLALHMESHIEEESDENNSQKDKGISNCNICKMKFLSTGELDEHMDKQHSIVCRYCNQKFANQNFYFSHNCSAKRNLEQRKSTICYVCHKCCKTQDGMQLVREDAIFANEQLLREHNQTFHAGDNEAEQYYERPAPMSVHSFGEFGIDNEQIGEEARAQSAIEWMEPSQQSSQEIMLPYKDREIRCEVCHHLYNSIEMLCDHWMETESEREHSFRVVTCPICKLTNRGTAEAANHLKYFHFVAMRRINVKTTIKESKTVKKLFACATCSRVFKKRNDLTRHERIHNGEKPFKCDVCGLSFRIKSTLKEHKAVHDDSPPTWPCKFCDRLYYEKKSLKQHLRIHTGEKPFKCNMCDESFRTSTMVKNHILKCKGPAMGKAADPDRYLPQKDIVSYRYDQKGVLETLEQVSVLPATSIKPSTSSAFTSVSRNANQLDDIASHSTIYVITKPIHRFLYAVVAQMHEPSRNSYRESVDTVSAIELSELRPPMSISIVLHGNLRLNVNVDKLIEAIQNSSGLVKEQVRIGDSFSPMDLYQIVEFANTAFEKTCNICTESFETKEQSDAHFASEDHETAMHMLPSRNSRSVLAIESNYPNYFVQQQTDVTDYACKLCGKKFFDMDPLVAHIRREHDRDGDAHIPPRPIAHTAPIH